MIIAQKEALILLRKCRKIIKNHKFLNFIGFPLIFKEVLKVHIRLLLKILEVFKPKHHRKLIGIIGRVFENVQRDETLVVSYGTYFIEF